MAIRLSVIVVAAALAGLAAVVATAALSARPVLFLAAGLTMFCVLAAGGIIVATRRLPVRAQLVAFTVSALRAGMFAAAMLVPAGDPGHDPAPVAGQGFWQLPAGSRIAYVRVPAHGHPGQPRWCSCTAGRAWPT